MEKINNNKRLARQEFLNTIMIEANKNLGEDSIFELCDPVYDEKTGTVTFKQRTKKEFSN